MADPYQYLATEGTVSSSQEDLLQRIPGWEDEKHPSLSPSQVDLPLSRLCGASSSDNEGSAEHREPAFGLKGPLELASPDTEACQEDSYNPAFESDRERSLSPRGECSMFAGVWGSRLITQSQDTVGDIGHLLQMGSPELHGILRRSKGHATRRQILCSEELGKKARTSLQMTGKEYCQSKSFESVGFGNPEQWPNAVEVPAETLSSRAKLKDKTSVADVVDACNVQDKNHSAKEVQFKPGETGLIVHKGSEGNVLEDLSAKEATLRSKSSATTGVAIVMNAEQSICEKGKDEKWDASHEINILRQRDHLQREQNQVIDENVVGSNETKGILSNASSEVPSNALIKASKRLLPAIISRKESTSGKRAAVEIDRVSKPKVANYGLFPESVMDVVRCVSGVLSTSSPDEPDFLSVVMGTGVSLSMPLRNCKGDLILRQDHS